MNKVNLINKKHLKNTDALIKQYSLICESADRITDKRQNTNNYFLTVNSFIFVASGYILAVGKQITPLLISFIGLVISSIWIKNINSYKKLNSAKFKVIHELESNLPANIYKMENEYLKKGYYKLTSIEKNIPIIFGVLYFIMIIVSVSSIIIRTW